MDQLSKGGTGRWRILSSLALVVLLGSCRAPFSNRMSEVDWAASPLAGTIAVSEPKMYRRESLINERRRDVEWIEGMLEPKSFAEVKFEPEMQRELEQITVFAAAIGLNFDPVRGADYRRESETSAIEHKINVLDLQLQLDQLTRDAELLRSRFAAQTEPSGTGTGGKSEDGGKPPATASQKGEGQLEDVVTQLKKAVDQFSDKLVTQLKINEGDPRVAKSAVNPSDLFRDKLAYRDLLKAALNSSSLDDMHDFGGAALIRLNFQAMVLPERDRARVPGVVQMTIKPPPDNAPEWKMLYRQWLDHINQRLNRPTENGWQQDLELLVLSDSGLFTLADYYVPRRSGQPGTPQEQMTGAQATGQPAAESGDIVCNGFAPRSVTQDAACAKLVFAVPRFAGASVQEGAYHSLNEFVERSFQPYADSQAHYDATTGMHALVNKSAAQLVVRCSLPARPPSAADQSRSAREVLYAIRLAQERVAAGDEVARVERAAQYALRQAGAPMVRRSDLSERIASHTAEARFLLSTFEEAAYGDCPLAARLAFRRSLLALFQPALFDEMLRDRQPIAVYEIGPRELVQQISSVSRIANNLSLALSLAAAAPRTGLGASSAGNYSRQAIGKAATFERVPSLIGYAASSRFGWVIMPAAVFDPKGDLMLEQRPRTIDLSVDLSIPAWWPYFELEAVTGWGSSAAPINGAAAQLARSTAMRVRMKTNYADLEQVTARMQSGAGARIHLDDPLLSGQHVAACRSTTLYVRGAHLWRASAVVVGGHALAASEIDVAPDMSGVLLTVPALADLVTTERGTQLSLSVYTRDGEAAGKVNYLAPPQPDGCRAPGKTGSGDTPEQAPAAGDAGAAKAEAPSKAMPET